MRWGGDLLSRVRASDYILSICNDACCLRLNPVEVYNIFCELSLVCLRIILALVVRPSQTLINHNVV